MDVIRSLTRKLQIGYHLAEAEMWLAASAHGAHSTPLAYAAFELRLEVERVALELLVRMRGDALIPEDHESIRAFGKMENKIYELEGHQRTLDRKIAFFNTMLDALQVDWRCQPINVGRLRSWWHYCSELCHVTWTLIADSKEGPHASEQAFEELSQIREQLGTLITKGISWPRIADASFAKLQADYLENRTGDVEVRAWLSERGLWASKVSADGSSEFVGVAVPPTAG